MFGCFMFFLTAGTLDFRFCKTSLYCYLFVRLRRLFCLLSVIAVDFVNLVFYVFVFDLSVLFFP